MQRPERYVWLGPANVRPPCDDRQLAILFEAPPQGPKSSVPHSARPGAQAQLPRHIAVGCQDQRACTPAGVFRAIRACPLPSQHVARGTLIGSCSTVSGIAALLPQPRTRRSMASDSESHAGPGAAGSPPSRKQSSPASTPTERALKDRVEQLISKIRPAVHSEARRHSIFFYVDQLIKRCFQPEEVKPHASRLRSRAAPAAAPTGCPSR